MLFSEGKSVELFLFHIFWIFVLKLLKIENFVEKINLILKNGFGLIESKMDFGQFYDYLREYTSSIMTS